jgi:geranylgeranyl diphosphate synthase type 3
VLTRYALEELLNLHRGQGMDLFWRDNLRCPTAEDYLEMVSNSACFLPHAEIRQKNNNNNNNNNNNTIVNLVPQKLVVSSASQ